MLGAPSPPAPRSSLTLLLKMAANRCNSHRGGNQHGPSAPATPCVCEGIPWSSTRSRDGGKWGPSPRRQACHSSCKTAPSTHRQRRRPNLPQRRGEGAGAAAAASSKGRRRRDALERWPWRIGALQVWPMREFFNGSLSRGRRGRGGGVARRERLRQSQRADMKYTKERTKGARRYEKKSTRGHAPWCCHCCCHCRQQLASKPSVSSSAAPPCLPFVSAASPPASVGKKVSTGRKSTA